MRASVSLLWLGPFLSLLPMGCGHKDQRLPVHPTRGQVLYEGKPIPHAIVVFHPLHAPDKSVPLPRAKVQDDGTFVLETYGTQDGAPAGEYAVTVEWWLSNAKQSDDAPPSNRLPVRYAKAGTSGLRARVQADENQIPTIYLSR